MKLEKAIKILEGEMECWSLHPEAHLPKAIRLGTEALKWVRRHRPRSKIENWPLLPGETE